jgi:hypothetical protein
MKTATARQGTGKVKVSGREPSSVSGDIYISLVPELLRYFVQTPAVYRELTVIRKMFCDPTGTHSALDAKHAVLRVHWDSATSNLGAASDRLLRTDLEIVSGMLRRVFIRFQDDIDDWAPSVQNLHDRYADFDISRLTGNKESLLVHRTVGPEPVSVFHYLTQGGRK